MRNFGYDQILNHTILVTGIQRVISHGTYGRSDFKQCDEHIHTSDFISILKPPLASEFQENLKLFVHGCYQGDHFNLSRIDTSKDELFNA